LRFGHAGSIVEGRADTAAAKAGALREVGVLVAEDLSEIPSLLTQALCSGNRNAKS
jgi:succinyl-CoA synthetase alpha subunit